MTWWSVARRKTLNILAEDDKWQHPVPALITVYDSLALEGLVEIRRLNNHEFVARITDAGRRVLSPEPPFARYQREAGWLADEE